MSIIDNAVYVDGRRTAPPSLELTFETLRDRGGVAWIDLYRPSEAELRAVAQEFELHPLAVEDAVHAHQRSKLDRYDDVVFVVVHPARYLDDAERVEFGELHAFVGPDFVVTVRQAESPDVAAVRARLEADPDRLRHGPVPILHALLDQVVDEYAPVLDGLRNDVDEIEDQLFDRSPGVSRRIYELSREVIAFQRATHPLADMLRALESGAVLAGAVGAGRSGAASAAPDGTLDVEMQRSLRDVLDHTIRCAEQVDEFRTLLENALTVHSTLVAQEQNEEMRRLSETSVRQAEQAKKISSWAAILFTPTLVASIYGMNFEHMPELHWLLGYPMALALMLVLAVALYRVFKKVDWL
ncbi:magnesium and cobalt transport protein CorA [Puerhibacterium puerhi]|uniref:magnesium and cobalt transport protein CorA n=1 Tax=Puerhibacterium puerhi TaxID=2692623 RepID=UPI00135871E8|nr:magnesium and cobalt transport protein CorA [Puerhibacterium puerhi]